MVRYPGRGVSYGELWYDEVPPGDPGVDILVYRQASAPVPGARSTPFLSLQTDLSAAQESIAARFHETCRYQIRRADTKDALRMEVITDTLGRIEEFGAFYDAFARQKSIWPSDRKWLAGASNAGQLILTSASRGAEALVWHAYLLAGSTARLQYSGSCFRGMDAGYRALVGRANRWLHWKDLLLLKEMNIARYDWGGLFDDDSAPERAGINQFKSSFGGRPVRSYDCSLPVSLRGRLWLPLRDAWRGWKSAAAAQMRTLQQRITVR